ncbi:sugar transferase [Reichenbachiella ulvae]|uniref:Sugar transferase n=1 Tax=Reichenbachiella ulvae TaxID=2980104 RepID=A0ABT3CMY2_9BACT|nr:sugar transferase [Reichenbachiella ulvae]MCV9385038.1 sugar transferase [Reichenbachiella ulvae]
MNETASLESNLDNKSKVEYHVSNIQETLDQPIIIFLGESLFKQILDTENGKYELINAQSPELLINLIVNWNTYYSKKPEAILLSDNVLSKLNAEKLEKHKKNSSFKTVPLIVFSDRKNEQTKDLARSIGADEYFHKPIKFKSLIPRIKFYKRLKEAGFSKEDSILNEDKEYSMYFLKRTFDITVSLSILLLVSPLLFLTALIIKLESKGPIFYISKRAGTNYKIFDFYKFRSMQVDADSQLEKLKETANQYQDGNQFVKIKNDPRVTRIGNFIRNTSIDELPQLINVLKGDMSIVGNRPLPLYEAQLLTTDEHAERFLGPAGITGLWQTLKRGKGDMSAEERIMLDRIYVRKNSLLFDFKLMLKTIPALIQAEKV